MDHLTIGFLNNPFVGQIWFAVNNHGLFAIDFPATQESFFTNFRISSGEIKNTEQISAVHQQLTEYLEGNRRKFDLPIDWEQFTDFQKKVLRATYEIPYSQTMTYKQIAYLVGSPKGARAVGRVEATNPLPIVIPCHRVLGSDHTLRGYGAGSGLPTKQWLIDLERTQQQNKG